MNLTPAQACSSLWQQCDIQVSPLPLYCFNKSEFRPSELTPLTALKLAEIYKEVLRLCTQPLTSSQAGLPDGVFNVVLGDSKTGQLLISHPDVVKVSLTGSVETG